MLTMLALTRILPVIVIDYADDAVPLAEALLEGGLAYAEVSCRTPAAEEAVRRMAAVRGMTMGAGTILSIEQAKRVLDAGVRFIVSPGFDAEIVQYCVANKVPVVPGVCTPTEIQMALKAGATALKFFPAEPSGGATMLETISAPFPLVRFIPMGGIDTRNIASYLRLPCVLACGGSWMVKRDLVNAHAFDTITSLSREAVEISRSFNR